VLAIVPNVFDKLNLKSQRDIVVVNAPGSFEHELESLDQVRICRDLATPEELTFALIFVTTQTELDAPSKAAAAKVRGDAVLWFAYPKQTSTRYQCEFNRDKGWDVLLKAGFDTVRQVAIDEDWSALRFRRIELVKQSDSVGIRCALTRT
jgi:hypothetical protein